MAGPVCVYISVPFCKAKCTFCNFASDVFGAERMQPYMDRLCGEIRGAHTVAERIEASLPRAVDTIYFGGGTPSLLSGQEFKKIFQHLRSEFDLDPDAEITLECAPGQLADETLDELLQQGMNRISFGVQSFVDQETAAVGRLHTRQQCDKEIARVTAAGVREINVDLIVGLPHQTAQSWQYSVEQAVASGAPHISVYLLEVDDDSRLGREMLKQGSRYSATAVPDEDQSAEWYQQACDMLHEAGVQQYEISNFARPGHHSRHNLKYWQRQPYIGFGLDAHSMLLAGRDAVRFANTSDLDRYLGQAAESNSFRIFGSGDHTTHAEVDVVGRGQAFEESLFLGLRLNEGVDLDQLRRQFGEDLLEETMPALMEVRDAGLLELYSDNIRLTPQGRLASNEVFSRLLIPTAA
ncbi:radical SAM family heme chaperone HemW [Tunturiibacter empetritectus]|uniref:Heme chaperone HemW n=1 Tax=Tunturiibacter lichenicola TaxID=2051959 RepID=A0A852V8Z9_9BACT|nr:radical SAM family heme chaperone HemW [Edaphobacter lichenicola]NYF89428.1 oxygen-independent coproporphyrinogen-3 oxidase [Edaphobacter lichenicola]